jgi:protein-disulfide isomerase
MTLRRPALALLLAPLALGVAACNKSDASGGDAPAAAVAQVPPPAGKAWADVVSATPDGGMRMGNPTAPIKLVEYGSLSCPHCAKLAQDGMQTLVDKYVNSGRVSYEFRSFAIHPQDVPLTVLVQCAGPETFFPMVEQIYTNFDAMNAPMQDQAVMARAEAATKLPGAQRMVALSSALGYTDFFAARGIAIDQANACLANGTSAQQVAERAQKWTAAGVNSTPTLELNGRKLENTATWGPNETASGKDPGLEVALQNAGAR